MHWIYLENEVIRGVVVVLMSSFACSIFECKCCPDEINV